MVGDAFDDAQFTRDNLLAFNALKRLEFEGLGTVHYEHIQAALTENEGAWRGGSHQDDVYAIQQFCQRIVQLTESLRQRTGRRIANDVVGTTASDAAGDAGPPFEEPDLASSETKEEAKTEGLQCNEDGNAALTSGQYEEAVRHYNAALLYLPDNAIILSNRALAYTKMENYEMAIQDATNAIAIDPTYPKGYY
ncbi:hypothetical protein ACHAW5_007598 [Stephanodiscus triporus]|uniref:Uncharacterized protein n=1 Tax=Stephanodiscus triporus TaxID=2934178 RepID=A0ABD3MM76_9STRA